MILSIHIIAVISWMAGILYLFRLFIYHQEETESVVKQRFEVMEERLFRIITAPAMGTAFVAGVFMVSLNFRLLSQGWFHGKLLLVAVLMGVTMWASKLRRDLAEGRCAFTSKQLRILNEVPTLLMIGIVFLVLFLIEF